MYTAIEHALDSSQCTRQTNAVDGKWEEVDVPQPESLEDESG